MGNFVQDFESTELPPDYDQDSVLNLFRWIGINANITEETQEDIDNPLAVDSDNNPKAPKSSTKNSSDSAILADSFQIYLRHAREMARRYKIETPEQEAEYWRIIRESLSKHQYGGVNSKHETKIFDLNDWKNKSKNENPDIASHAKTVLKAYHSIFYNNLNMVTILAKQIYNSPSLQSFSIMDGIQDGTFGLNRAIATYAPDKNIQFTTWLKRWVKGSILKGLHQLLGLKNKRYSDLSNVQESISSLKNELGRHPTHAEIAQKSDIPLNQVKGLMDLQAMTRDAQSYDELPNEPAQQSDGLRILQNQIDADRYLKELKEIDPAAAKIALAHFFGKQSFKDIAANLGYKNKQTPQTRLARGLKRLNPQSDPSQKSATKKMAPETDQELLAAIEIVQQNLAEIIQAIDDYSPNLKKARGADNWLRDRDMIKMRLGIGHDHMHTYRSVGVEYGVSLQEATRVFNTFAKHKQSVLGHAIMDALKKLISVRNPEKQDINFPLGSGAIDYADPDLDNQMPRSTP